MATIHQRKNSGSFQFTAVINGKRFRKDFRSQKEAEVFHAQFNLDKARGVVGHAPHVNASRPRTWKELQQEVYTRCWAGTKGERTAVINSLAVIDYFGRATRLPAVLTKYDIDGFVDKLKHWHNNSGATINRKLAALSKMLKFAKQRGWVTFEFSLDREKESNGRLRWLTKHEEESLILNTLELGRGEHAALWVFLIDTGARVGEALKLEWKDVNFEQKTATFWDTKNNEARTVPLTSRVMNMLEDNTNKTSPFELSQPNVNYVWQQVKAKMGLAEDKEFVPHALRHTCASRLVQNGIPVLTVMKFLGHKSVQITLRYAHLSTANFADAVAVLENK